MREDRLVLHKLCPVSRSTINWIGKALTSALHDRQLARPGDGAGVCDQALLDSALARPQRSFADGDPPPHLADLAANPAFGLTRSHPFADGNRHASHACDRTLVARNGTDLDAGDEEKYVTMLNLADGSVGETGFATRLRPHIAVRATGGVHETAAGHGR